MSPSMWNIATSATWPPDPKAPSPLSITPAAADATSVPCHGQSLPPLHVIALGTPSAPVEAGERSGMPALEKPPSSTASLTRLDVLAPIASARQASPVPSELVYHGPNALSVFGGSPGVFAGTVPSAVERSSTAAPSVSRFGA